MIGGGKISKKMILIITFFIICLNVKTQIYAKYTISHNFDIANIELDRTKPTIQIIKEETTNIQNNKYANNKDEIILIAEIKERNIEKEAIDKSKITVKVENKTINPNIEIKKVEENKNTGKYQIKITNIQENGKLKKEVEELKSELELTQTALNDLLFGEEGGE